MKRRIALTIIFLLFILVACDNQSTHSVNEVKGAKKIGVKIGATFPLTGVLSMYGEAYRNGMLLAQEEINKNQDIKLELEIMDNKGGVKTVNSDVNYLIDVKKLSIIFNSFEYLTLASKDISEAKRTPVIAYTVYRLTRDNEDEYLFRDYWDMEKIGQVFGGAAKKIESKQVGLITLLDSSHNYFEDGFVSSFGKDFQIRQEYPYETKDFKTLLLKFKSSLVDTIVVYGLPNDVSLILSQMSKLNMNNYKVLSIEASEDFVTEQNKNFLQKTKTISYLGSKLDEAQQGFIQKYKEKYNQHPRPDAFYTYEDTKLVYQILVECGADKKDVGIVRECVRDKLENYFDEDHNNYRELPLTRYDQGWQEFIINN